MTAAQMRQNARSCLNRAKALLDQDDEASVRYACLELRFAIEYLVYQNLQAYLSEVSDDAMRKWKPKDVIKEMLAVDPQADQTSILLFGREESYGVPAKDMKVLGEDRRFSWRWADKSHHALSNFLHSRTLFQIENEKTATTEIIRTKAGEVAKTIEHILASGIYNVRWNVFEVKCSCGVKIKRQDVMIGDELKCPCCGAIWDVASVDANSPADVFAVKLRTHCKVPVN